MLRSERQAVLYRVEDVERSPLAKAAAGLLAAVDNATRGFESLPSPPPPSVRVARVLTAISDVAKQIYARFSSSVFSQPAPSAEHLDTCHFL